LANSFNITASATTYNATAANNQIQRVRGIVHSGGTATTASTTIANNTIANLRMNYAATATGPGAARGIVFDNPTPANIRGAIQIQNNTIFNLTSNQNFAASGATANVVGIDFNLSGNSEVANTNISGNTIYGLTTSGSTVITNALGIYYSGRSAGTQTINGNYIRDLVMNKSDKETIVADYVDAKAMIREIGKSESQWSDVQNSMDTYYRAYHAYITNTYQKKLENFNMLIAAFESGYEGLEKDILENGLDDEKMKAIFDVMQRALRANMRREYPKITPPLAMPEDAQ
jgi:hypothetical protein